MRPDRVPRLLIGPLYNPAVLGKYATHPDIKLFMPRSSFTEHYDYDLVYEPEQVRHFNDLFDALPAQWEPELVIWWDIVYQAILPGVSESRYPTALIPGDWNLAFSTVLNFAHQFDMVFADTRLGAILKQENVENVIHWPNFAYDSKHVYREQRARVYDIGFIGNLNTSIHPERSRYLDKILSLQDRYQIFVQQGVWGADYRRVLNQSKIVFNYTICQVLNMRAYEAPACGALLFIEEENVEANQVYVDGESCIFYNQDNLLERLAYYLEHDAEREQIAEAGYQIALNYSHEASFQRLLGSIPDSFFLAQIADQRLANLRKSPEIRLIHDLNQMVSSSSFGVTQALPFLQQLNQSLQELGFIELQHVWRIQATISLLFPIIDENQSLHYVFQVSLETFHQIYAHLIKLKPYHPIFYYHLALVLEYLDRGQEALWYFGQTIELLAAGHTADFLDYTMFIIPFNKSGRGIDSVVFSWEKAAYTAIEKQISPLVESASILAGYIWRRMGFILKKQQKHQKAALAFENAYTHLQLVEPLVDLAQIYYEQGSHKELLETISRFLEREPFAIRHLPGFMSYALYQQGSPRILEWVRPYLAVFKELKSVFFLAHCMTLASAERTQHWQAMLDFDFEIAFYKTLFQILNAKVGDPQLEVLQPLKKLFHFDWQLSLEPAVRLAAESGMAWSTRHSDIQIGKDTLQWQRVYDQAGDWERQQIGPDLLPFAFPAESLDSLDSDMMDLLTQHQSYLLILTKESSCLSQILSDLDQAFEANSQIQLLLWNPDQGFELQRYSEQLESCKAPVVWLDESFSPAEQSCLLQQSRLMIDPTGQGYYYAHWAWFLGRPVIWTRAASFDAYPELAALYATVPFQDHFEPVDMQSVQRLQAALLKKQETLQAAWLNGLWQIKVRATLAY